MNPEYPQPPSSTELDALLVACSGQLKILCRSQPDSAVEIVNDTLNQIQSVRDRLPKTVRLLPLVANGPGEKLANLLAQLLVDDESQAENGARAALMILTGIQAFFDSGGDAKVLEHAWRPAIIARALERKGPDAWKEAAALAGEALAADRHDVAALYERVALMLKPEETEKT